MKLISEGRIMKIRDVSSKLAFYDLIQDGVKVQAVVNWKSVGGEEEDFRDWFLGTRVGDIVSEFLHSP